MFYMMCKRTMKTCAVLCTGLIALTACQSVGQQVDNEPKLRLSEYVNPMVGTLSTHGLSAGNTYPAIALPWGMNFWTPQTGVNGNGWTYTYASSTIRGIKQTHQPSPWINDYGQFSLMPVAHFDGVEEDKRMSHFSHLAEESHPYYYKVYFADHDVRAEVTPTERAAMMRFTYPESQESAVVIDAFDRGSYIRVLPEKQMVVGYTTRNVGGVTENFKNWFVIRFDAPIVDASIYSQGDKKKNGSMPAAVEKKGVRELADFHVLAAVRFHTSEGQQVHARVASSFISLEQAERNLLELGEDSFMAVREKAQKRWDDVLGRIEVSGGNLDQYRTFYSCLYRATLFPRKLYEIDADGQPVHYSPYTGDVLPGYLYGDTGFWDTFRALFPLLNLVYPDVNAEIQQGLAHAGMESGFIPEWSSPGHRGCMVGNNSASVVADAILSGVNNQYIDTLYTVLQHATRHEHPTVSSSGRKGHEYYNKLGYVPYNVGMNENVARTLEYAYDDWCILQLAKKLHRPADEIAELEKRSQNYRHVFDERVGLMRGRNEDGAFQTPFSPYKWGDAFTEGNSWHYTWSVFHDVQGLVNLMGGKEAFINKLDSVFIVPPVYDASYYGKRIHEILEMQVADMGNYAHGNQPAQHMTYLYDYVGEPWKTQFWVREVMNRLYTPQANGYCGDEDNGQTSAWYIFSALGWYPVCPGSGQYALGAPLFKKATIHLTNGHTVTVDVPNNNAERRYIDKMTVNGQMYSKNYLDYEQLLKGACIDVKMAAQPTMSRGVTPDDMPYSYSNIHD